MRKGANTRKIFSGPEYQNLDVYQVNCTYYSALACNDDSYIAARAIQFFTPGIPQVYYVGLLAGENDIELVQHTKNGRDINRHNYTLDEIAVEIQKPVVNGAYCGSWSSGNSSRFWGPILPSKMRPTTTSN
jgi:sucrose phosphorylase